DFIYVHSDQITLDVYFLRDTSTLDVPMNGTVTEDQIAISSISAGDEFPEVPVDNVVWLVISGANVMRVTTEHPGDFSLYTFTLTDSRIDPYYNGLTFNFKANCPSDLDCKTPDHECPEEDWVDFPIDYMARDFDSFRTALLDFASLRYPDWNDRLEADAGVMWAEILSALGDEMAFYQDRVAREAHLETATQRRSVRRHARLIDYHMHDGLGATTWLDVTVEDGASGTIAAGTDVWALSDDESEISFEIGNGLREVLAGVTYAVDSARNEFEPHCWDEDDTCLPLGSTEIHVLEEVADVLFPALGEDVEYLLLTTIPTPDLPTKSHLVRLVSAENTTDPVFGTLITRIVWEDADATPFEMDMTLLRVRGNIVPVTAGRTLSSRFIVGEDADPDALADLNYGALPRAVEREGAGKVPIYLHSLEESDEEALVWLGDEPTEALPEISLREVEYDGTNWQDVTAGDWNYRTSMLGSPSSQGMDPDYVLDDGMWRRVVGYHRPTGEVIHQDYATGAGKTIRFGDGEFGLIPAEGTIFQADYRIGNGAIGNVAAESIVNFEDSDMPIVTAISNPFPAENGENEESLADVKKLAPEAFKAVTYRAVRPEDYAEAAERLDWVDQAGGEFRWTGSWLTAFVTPDPENAVVVLPDQETELNAQLDRFRQAGREAYMRDPVYANIDLEIKICLERSAFAGEVRTRVSEALFGKKGLRPTE
ncbi:MAG: hypothetical protein AAF570_14820, partial [Bacteroidota bacterium]